MSPRDEGLKAIHWGIHPQVVRSRVVEFAVIAALTHAAAPAAAEPVATRVEPDPPPASSSAFRVAPAHFTPSWDLDGLYLWLGPLGAASYARGAWDSTVGAEAVIVSVRERAAVSLWGIDLGGSRWTAQGGGRVWVDGLIGTRVFGHMMGASLGPILELAETAHPRLGGSIGAWGFAGIAPFVRVGGAFERGFFAEFGVHIVLPVLHR